MATWGEKVIAEAQNYIGQIEGRPNCSGGFIVDACQHYYGMGNGTGVGPQPWCGCYTGYVAGQINYENYKAICSPGVAVTYARAAERGWLKGRGNRNTPMGALFLIDGRHIGFVLEAGDTYFTTVEGNASDGCRSLTRAWSDGWEVIIPPDLGNARPSDVKTVYGFDDLNIKPRRYGGWARAEVRDRQQAKFGEAQAGWWTRSIRIATNAPYAFEAGKSGTYGQTYEFGPWHSRDSRNAEMAKYAKRVGHDHLRTWSKKIKTVPGAEPGSGGSANGIGDVE